MGEFTGSLIEDMPGPYCIGSGFRTGTMSAVGVSDLPYAWERPFTEAGDLPLEGAQDADSYTNIEEQLNGTNPSKGDWTGSKYALSPAPTGLLIRGSNLFL